MTPQEKQAINKQEKLMEQGYKKLSEENNKLAEDVFLVGTESWPKYYNWDVCPGCGGGLLITKELITTTIGERWFTKQVCMNRKTSGCL